MPFISSLRRTGSGSPVMSASRVSAFGRRSSRGSLNPAEQSAVSRPARPGPRTRRPAQASPCSPERNGLALELHPRRQDVVLEAIRLLGQLADDQPTATGVSKPEEPLASLSLRSCVLGLFEVYVLLAGEQILVPGHDCRLLARLLLANSNGTSLLGALEEELRQALLELIRRQRCVLSEIDLIPRRSRRFSSRRQRGRGLTMSSRNTFRPRRRSISGRAREPIVLIIEPPFPTRMPFWDSVST